MKLADIKKEGLLLFEAVVGSRAYGVATGASDTDIKGVFYMPKELFYSADYVAQVNDAKNDQVYYELARFIELLGKSNPNILELLYSPCDCVRYRSPLFAELFAQDFVSREMAETFARYAWTQVGKARGLNKKINNPMAMERKSLFDFCYLLLGNKSVPLTSWLAGRGLRQADCGLAKIDHTKGVYALYHDHDGTASYRGIAADPQQSGVCCSSIAKGATMQGYLYVNQEAYSAHCKQHREYREWVSRRNEDRFASTLKHGRGYDAKNMMHSIRLLQTAKEILQSGLLQVRRSNPQELLHIKTGLYSYEYLQEYAEKIYAEIQLLSKASTLPPKPNADFLQGFLLRTRIKLYG